MILVDPRDGSKNLIQPLQQFGYKIRPKRLHSGDVVFSISWANSSTLKVVIEHKTLNDALSSLKTKRLQGHQIPKMLKEHAGQPTLIILMIEGAPFCGSNGELLELVKRRRKGKYTWVLEEPYGSWSYSVYRKMLHTISMRAGIHIVETPNLQTSVHWIASLYAWGKKTWEKHHTHLSFDRSVILRPDRILFTTPSQVEAFAKEIPGIGWERAKAVAEAFPFSVDMWEASKKDWMRIDGIGPLLATRAWETLHLRTKRRSKVVGAEYE